MKKIINILLSICIVCSCFIFSVNASAKESKYFNDLSNYQWAVDSVDYLYEIGLISGIKAPDEYNKGEFNPSGKVTKAEFSQMVYNLTGKNYNCTTIPLDVKQNYWYYASVVSEFSNGILEKDYINNKVYPDNYLSREECFCMIYRVLVNKYNVELNTFDNIRQFKDYKDVSTIYYSMIDALISNGYITGSNNNINPKRFLTRAELAVLFKSLIEKLNLTFEKINVTVPVELDTRIDNYMYDNFSEYDMNLIAWVIGGRGRNGTWYSNEVGSGSTKAKQAVAWEIINRYDCVKYNFGSSIYSIVCPGQYGSYRNTYSYDKVSEDTYNLVKDVCRLWAKEKVCALYPIDCRVLPAGFCWHTGDGHYNTFRNYYGNTVLGDYKDTITVR